MSFNKIAISVLQTFLQFLLFIQPILQNGIKKPKF